MGFFYNTGALEAQDDRSVAVQNAEQYWFPGEPSSTTSDTCVAAAGFISTLSCSLTIPYICEVPVIGTLF